MTKIYKLEGEGDPEGYLVHCGVKQCGNDYYASLLYILDENIGCPYCGVKNDPTARVHENAHKNLG